MKLRIATRRSALARAQAYQTGLALHQRTGVEVELVPLAASGDLHPDRPVGSPGDVKGLFVDRIREAVIDGDCHLAVHSLKDLPTEPCDGLVLAAVPTRQDPRDVLVTREGHALVNLPATAMVGTSSQRRRLQLLRVKPGLQVLALRGNLDTRLRKVAAGELDAVVVALAGLARLYVPEDAGGVGALGLPLTAAPLEPGECLPAPGQGALAVEVAAGDARTRELVEAIDHLPSRKAVAAERAFLAAVGGGCLAPVGALCGLTGFGGLELVGMLADPVRRQVLRRSLQGAFDDPEALGRALAEDMLAAGGAAMVASIAELRDGTPTR